MSEQHPIAAIICYTRCVPCQFGGCYDPPQAHRWAGPGDIKHAQATGQPEPTGICGCPCAHPTTEEVP